MQAFAGIADQRGQALLDIQVHVFLIELPLEIAADDLVFDLRQAALDVFQVLRADDLATGKHLRMRQGALDIEQREALVKIHRSGITLYQFCHGFVETSRPCLIVLHRCHVLSRMSGT